MKDITIQITDAEYKALEYINETAEDWILTAAKGRATGASEEIKNIYVNFKMAKNEAITATTLDEYIFAAFDEGAVKTAKETAADQAAEDAARE